MIDSSPTGQSEFGRSASVAGPRGSPHRQRQRIVAGAHLLERSPAVSQLPLGWVSLACSLARLIGMKCERDRRKPFG
jgi:hypothetical protein